MKNVSLNITYRRETQTAIVSNGNIDSEPIVETTPVCFARELYSADVHLNWK